MTTGTSPNKGAGADKGAAGNRRGALFALGSVASVQFGQAFGKLLSVSAGPAGVVVLRLGFAAALLLLLRRPRPPTERRAVLLVLAWGTAIAGMNTVYFALQFLPVGIVVTVQFLVGPFALALLGSRRPRDGGWAALAGVGVLLFAAPGAGSLSGTGLALAVVSGLSMAGYLALSARAGTVSKDDALLGWSVAWAAVMWLPVGLVLGPPPLDPVTLGLGAVLAAVSAVVPYRLDFAALRRLPPRTVAVLVSLEPVAGALAGLIVLGEHLDARQWSAIAAITCASMGAVATSGPARRGRGRAS